MGETPKLPRRSAEEGVIREMVGERLRQRWPSARIIHELPTRYSSNRIDMAAVTKDELVCVEIKSSRDVADRLEAQLEAFVPIATHMIVAVAPKWWPEPKALPPEPTKGRGVIIRYEEGPVPILVRGYSSRHFEAWTCCADTRAIRQVHGEWRFGRRGLPWPARMLDILHVAELEFIAERHRIPAMRPHLNLVEGIARRLTLNQVIEETCQALRARDAFCEGTDPPIKDRTATEATHA
jgi:hypothetical protein